MASKPRSQWSPAYRKRIESAERRGLEGTAKRGHKPAEHRTRAERARAEGRLTEADKRWLKRQQNRVKYDETNALGRERWANAVAQFAAMTPEERYKVRVFQRERERSINYASIYAPHPDNVLSPLYLSSRSGLR